MSKCQHKTPYQTKNDKINYWHNYEKSLAKRYSIHTWIHKNVLEAWKASKKKTRGKPTIYSDTAYITVLQFMEAYNYNLRQAEHSLRSMFELAGIKLEVPDHFSLCRARQRIKIPRVRKTSKGRARCLVFDSTGMKLLGDNGKFISYRG